MKIAFIYFGTRKKILLFNLKWIMENFAWPDGWMDR